jgi:hypothetical protein
MIVLLLVFVLGCFAICFVGFGLGSAIGLVGAVAKHNRESVKRSKKFFCPKCRAWLPPERVKHCSSCGLAVKY